MLRVTHENLLSRLNNIVTFDMFNDDVYTDDYGLTEEEFFELGKLADFDISEARAWYNGKRVYGKPINNTSYVWKAFNLAR